MNEESLDDTKSIISSEVMATAKVVLNVLFETLYKENLDKKPKERNESIIEGLKPYVEKELGLTKS